MKVFNILRRTPSKTPQDFIQILKPATNVFETVGQKNYATYDLEGEVSEILNGVRIGMSFPDSSLMTVKKSNLYYYIDVVTGEFGFNKKPRFNAINKAYDAVQTFMTEFNSKRTVSK